MIQEKQKWKEITKKKKEFSPVPQAPNLWVGTLRTREMEYDGEVQQRNQTQPVRQEVPPEPLWKQFNNDIIDWGWRGLFYNSLEYEFNNYIAL